MRLFKHEKLYQKVSNKTVNNYQIVLTRSVGGSYNSEVGVSYHVFNTNYHDLVTCITNVDYGRRHVYYH